LPKERRPWWRHREGQEGKDNLDKTRKEGQEGQDTLTRCERHVIKAGKTSDDDLFFDSFTDFSFIQVELIEFFR
jgi:hypothetical protein